MREQELVRVCIVNADDLNALSSLGMTYLDQAGVDRKRPDTGRNVAAVACVDDTS